MTPDTPYAAPSIGALAWRQTLRDFRAGELRLLALAVMLAVAALTAVGFFADRLNQGLARDAGARKVYLASAAPPLKVEGGGDHSHRQHACTAAAAGCEVRCTTHGFKLSRRNWQRMCMGESTQCW